MNKLAGCFLFFLISGGTFFAQDVFDAARNGDVKRLEELVKINPDTVNAKNASGFTPLIIAGYRDQINAVNFLLDHQADVQTDSPEGPAILAACYKGNLNLAKILVAYKANVNAVNIHGTSALMYAALSKNVELVKLLLRHGARRDLVEKSGKDALAYARMGGSEAMIALLSGDQDRK